MICNGHHLNLLVSRVNHVALGIRGDDFHVQAFAIDEEFFETEVLRQVIDQCVPLVIGEIV